MSGKTINDRIIFGLKVKQKRQAANFSFSDLAERSGLSVSYLNEIEKGKKYPKSDKIEALAAALNVPSAELISPDLSPNLAPVSDLLKSNFLNELPLDVFGIELSKVVEIIANAPSRVGAFISTLLELSRNYALNEESFYFGALRSYLQLHNNYFESIETDVDNFVKTFRLTSKRPVAIHDLEKILSSTYGYSIQENGLETHPELTRFRSVFLPVSKQLLLNGKLGSQQKRFQFGKEIGFNFMKLKERANTSSILVAKSFEEVLNHSKAIYFSVALHIPLNAFVEDLQAVFLQKKWSNERWNGLMDKYDVSPEMFYHRLTNVLPQFFGIQKLFFLRFYHDKTSGTFEVDRELHLNRAHQPHSNGLNEHYCRRWVAISVFLENQDPANNLNHIRIQRSRYYGTNNEFLCFTIAQKAENHDVSVTIGLMVDETLQSTVRFLADPVIPQKEVNMTCERCAIMNCKERVAPPVVYAKKQQLLDIQRKLQMLENQ